MDSCAWLNHRPLYKSTYSPKCMHILQPSLYFSANTFLESTWAVLEYIQKLWIFNILFDTFQKRTCMSFTCVYIYFVSYTTWYIYIIHSAWSYRALQKCPISEYVGSSVVLADFCPYVQVRCLVWLHLSNLCQSLILEFECKSSNLSKGSWEWSHLYDSIFLSFHTNKLAFQLI